MMSKCKRIVAFALLALMLLSLLPAAALATATSIEGLTNLVTGGDFESDFSISVGEQSLSPNGGASNPVKAEIDATVFRGNGTTGHSLKVGANLTSAASTKWLSVSIKAADNVLTEGHTYRFIVYAKKGDDSSAPEMRLTVDGSQKKLPQHSGSSDWEMLWFDWQYSAADGNLVVYFRNYSGTANSYCYFDDFAIYDLDEQFYTVTWKNYDGTVLETDEKLSAVSDAQYNGEPPVWPDSEKYTYEFAGWSDAATDAAGNVTYTAQYVRLEKLVTSNGDFDNAVTSVNSWKTQIGTKNLSWSTSSSTNGQKGVVTTAHSRSGDQSIKIGTEKELSAGNKWVSITVPVDEESVFKIGNTYRIVVYSLKDSENISVPQLGVRPYAGSTKLDEITDKRDDTDTENWVKHEVVVEIPETTDKVIIYLYNYMTGANIDTAAGTDTSCYFDDLAIYDVTNNDVYTPAVLDEFTLSLKGVLDANYYVDWKGNDSANYTVEIKVGDEVRDCTSEVQADGRTCYSAPLYYYEYDKTVTATLKEDGEVIGTASRTAAQYAANLKAQHPSDTKLHALLDALEDYMQYGYCYNQGTAASESLTLDASVIDQSLAAAVSSNTPAGVIATLYLDEACDLLLKLPAAAFENGSITVSGSYMDRTFSGATAINTLEQEGGYYVLKINEILLQDWDTMLTFTITGVAADDIVITYSPMSYIRSKLTGTSSEERTGLFDLLRAMYYYQIAGEAYFATQS